ncbi:MAG: hypothetical protein WKF57_03935 [Nakamurella sp.]
MSIRRAPAGIPTGGQFATQNRPETGVRLVADAPIADPFDEVQRAEAAALATGAPGSYRAVIAAMQCVDPDMAADPAWRLDAFNDTRMRLLERADLRDMEEHDGPDELDGNGPDDDVDEAQEAAQIAAAAAVSTALSRSMGIEPDTAMPTVLFRLITDVPALARDYRAVHGQDVHPAPRTVIHPAPSERESAELEMWDAGKYLDDSYTDLERARAAAMMATTDEEREGARAAISVAHQQVNDGLDREIEAHRYLRSLLDG